MARGSTATVEEQAEMFPELSDSAEHKELLKRARKYNKEKTNRDELLKTNKTEVDGLMDRLIEQMHECKMTKFRHGDIIVELVAGREKAKVTVDTGEEDQEEDDSGDEE